MAEGIPDRYCQFLRAIIKRQGSSAIIHSIAITARASEEDLNVELYPRVSTVAIERKCLHALD